MTIFYNLKIGSWACKITPLSPVEKDYPHCDKDGNLLTKVPGTYTKGHFVNDATGEKHTTTFRLINGKPFAKMDKTKEVTKYFEVDSSEADDLLVEKQYLVECDSLCEDLKNSGKALKFPFTNGYFKGYKAYLLPSKIYSGFMIMYLGTTQISDIIRDIITDKDNNKKAKQVELTVQGIRKASVDDLIAI